VLRVFAGGIPKTWGEVGTVIKGRKKSEKRPGMARVGQSAFLKPECDWTSRGRGWDVETRGEVDRKGLPAKMKN